MKDKIDIIATYLRCVSGVSGFKVYENFTPEERAQFSGWANELIDYLSVSGYTVVPKDGQKP